MKFSPAKIRKFRQKIWRHYRLHGRDLPWRRTSDPYHILVSEIMLQQTQVDRVIPKYQAFIRKFPTAKALAEAPLREVLAAWQGLGYNRRALSLKKAAAAITSECNGNIPHSPAELQELPGIGPYTAAAVAVFAFNQPHVLIETNIRSVFIHEFFAEQNPEPYVVQGKALTKISDQDLLPLIAQTMSRKNPAHWYHALMDYGTLLKSSHPNPSRRSAHHNKQSRFEGSNRQIRGLLIKFVTEHGTISEQKLSRLINKDAQQVKQNISQLVKEGFIVKDRDKISIERR